MRIKLPTLAELKELALEAKKALGAFATIGTTMVAGGLITNSKEVWIVGLIATVAGTLGAYVPRNKLKPEAKRLHPPGT